MWRGKAHKPAPQLNKHHTKPGSHLHKYCACVHSYTTYRDASILTYFSIGFAYNKALSKAVNLLYYVTHKHTHTHTLTHTHTHMHTHTCTDTHTYTHTHMHTHMHRHTHVHTHTHTCLKGCFSTLLFALFEYSKWLKITGRCCWAWRPLPQVFSVPFLCMQCSLCNTSLLSLQSSFACYRRRLQPNRVMIVRLCAIRCICVWVQLLLRCGSLCSLSSKMHGTDIFTFSQPQPIPWGILLPRTRPKGTSFMPLFWFCCVKLPGSAFPIASCMLVPALGVFRKSIDIYREGSSVFIISDNVRALKMCIYHPTLMLTY